MSSSKSSGQWSSQSTNWSAALANHAKHKDPSKIPPTEIKCYDEYTMTIYDGFEKAKFHYLVLPRSGFPLDSTTGSKTVPDSHLESLNSLLKSPHAEQVLKKIELASKKLIREIEEEMINTPSPYNSKKKIGAPWAIHSGFHAVPSMQWAHAHVISGDLVSDRLKNKKHYLSFKHDHGFFLHLKTIQEYVEQGMTSLPKSAKAYDELLKKDLVSFHNQVTYKNIPNLKQHLLQAWLAKVKQSSEQHELANSSSSGEIGGEVAANQVQAKSETEQRNDEKWNKRKVEETLSEEDREGNTKSKK